MSVYDQNASNAPKRIFISYSSVDRLRTSGLALLLEAMGHQVFHDHRTIKPGMRWEAALQDGLDATSRRLSPGRPDSLAPLRMSVVR